MKKQKAFTIVELLVVIIIIGILATVIIISFSTITSRSTIATLQNDLNSAKKQIMNFQVQNASSNFPTSINTCPVTDASTQLCIKPTGTNTFTYTAYNLSDQQSFYLSASDSSNTYTYHTTDTTTVSDKLGVVANSLAYNLDFANTSSYAGSGSATYDLVSNTSGSLLNSSYYSYDSATKSMNFTRDGSIVIGGFHSITFTGNLTATNFLYNNHTMEIMARINDYNPSNINGNETASVLMAYQGYHSGFSYTSSALYFGIWNGVSNPSFNFASSPVAGAWFHAVETRIGNTTRLYLNGVLSSSSTYSTSNGNPGTTNTLKLGAGNPSTGPYAYYCKCNIAYAKLYNRGLTSAEVRQNFNATRDRYSL